MKTLFISDLDGTLLTAKENISEYSLLNLNRMIDTEGLNFTYATARSLNSAAKACWGLRQNLPVILYNGALIMEPSSRRVLYNNHFNEGQLLFLQKQFAEFHVWPLVYSFSGETERVSWKQGMETPGVLRYLERRRGDQRLHPVEDANELRGDGSYCSKKVMPTAICSRAASSPKELTKSPSAAIAAALNASTSRGKE